jgi:hypothetical protein
MGGKKFSDTSDTDIHWIPHTFTYTLYPLIHHYPTPLNYTSTLHLYTYTHSTEFEFKHNVCGRRIYAEGTADAVRYLASLKSLRSTKVAADKRLFNMIDVLEAGEMS